MTRSTGRSELDRHRNTDEAAVRDLRRRVAAAGVQFVHFQAVTMTGRVVGKAVPATHLARTVEIGVQGLPATLVDMRSTADGTPAGRLRGRRVHRWTRSGHLRRLAVGHPHRTVLLPPVRTGAPARRHRRPAARHGRPRHLLRRHAAFTARTGLHLRSGCEPEATWSGPNPDEAPWHRSPAHHFDSMEDTGRSANAWSPTDWFWA